jgi:hypothetical protein
VNDKKYLFFKHNTLKAGKDVDMINRIRRIYDYHPEYPVNPVKAIVTTYPKHF